MFCLFKEGSGVLMFRFAIHYGQYAETGGGASASAQPCSRPFPVGESHLCALLLPLTDHAKPCSGPSPVSELQLHSAAPLD